MQNTFEYPVMKATLTLIVFKYSQFVEVLMSIYLTRKPLDQNLDIHFKNGFMVRIYSIMTKNKITARK